MEAGKKLRNRFDFHQLGDRITLSQCCHLSYILVSKYFLLLLHQLNPLSLLHLELFSCECHFYNCLLASDLYFILSPTYSILTLTLLEPESMLGRRHSLKQGTSNPCPPRSLQYWLATSLCAHIAWNTFLCAVGRMTDSKICDYDILWGKGTLRLST